MGVVFEVWDRHLERTLAMKLGREPETLKRFLNEARVTGRLEHPGVVPVHDLGVDETGTPFFTMSLVEGKTLDAIFRLARAGEDGWTLARAVDQLVRVCETLAYAHSRGVIHRDLKPSNVMIGPFGESYVMDWGLAKIVGETDDPAVLAGARAASASPLATVAGTVLGTPAYMPPEQAAGELAGVDERADVYSVGALLYTLLTGLRPYVEPDSKKSSTDIVEDVLHGPPAPVTSVDPEAPPELVAICEKAMARSKSSRYETMNALREDLRAYLENRVVAAYRTGAVAELRKWVARNRAVAASIALFLVVGTLAFAAFTVWSELARRELEKERDDKNAALIARTEALAEKEEALASKSEALRAESDALRAKDAALERAEGLRLSALARVSLGTDPALAVLLAVEGVRTAPGLVAQSALHEALDRVREERTLIGHQDVIRDARFDHSGTRVASASEDRTIRVWDVETGEEILRLHGHGHQCNSVDFSSDDRYLVSASWDRTARVWNLETGALVHVLGGHGGGVIHAEFSGDGRLVLTACRDGKVRLFDVATGRLAATLEGHRRPVHHASFSADGSFVVSASTDGTARVWDAASGAERTLLEGHVSWIHRARFGPGDRTIATASADGTARLWDRSSGRLIAELAGHAGSVDDVAFDPSGHRVVTASADGSARIWSVPSGELLQVLEGHTDRVASASFSWDGRSVLTASSDRTVRIHDAASGAELARLLGHQARVTSARFAGNGARVVSTSWDCTVRVWDASVEDERRRLSSPWSTPSASGTLLAFSRDGERVLVHGPRLTIELRERPSGAVIAALEGHAATIHHAAFSPDGSRAVTSSLDGTARVWSLPNGDVTVLPGHGDEVVFATFDERGDRVVTASRDTYARVWDAATGELLATLSPRPGACCRAAVFDPSGERVATMSDFGVACVYELPDGPGGHRAPRRLYTLQHSDWLHGGTFSDDGRLLLVAANDDTMRLWDVESGEIVADLRGHSADFEEADFSADGEHLATRHADGSVGIWSLRSGVLLSTLEASRDRFVDVAFDGTRGTLHTVSSAGVVTRWPIDPLSTAETRRPRELSVEEQADLGVGTEEERREIARRRTLDSLERTIVLARRAWDADGLDRDALVSWGENLASDSEKLFRDGALAEPHAGRLVVESIRLIESGARRYVIPRSIGTALRDMDRWLEPRLASERAVDAALERRSARRAGGEHPSWRYFRDKSAPAVGSEWTEPGFDDRDWEEGPGPLGYGYPDVRTTLDDLRGGPTTLYARRSFEIDNPIQPAHVSLWFRVDDGFIAYLNGIEVGRARAGPIGRTPPFDALATATVPEPLAWKRVLVEGELLREGSNVLAVQVLNASASSSDLLLEAVVVLSRASSPEGDCKLLDDFRAVATEDDAAVLGYLEGRLAQRAGELASAERKFRAVHELAPESHCMLCRLVETMRANGKHEEADALLVEALEEAAANVVGDASSLRTASWGLVETHGADLIESFRAHMFARRANALDPLGPDGKTLAGAALYRLGLLEEARRTLEGAATFNVLRRAGRLDPRDLAFLALTCESAGRSEEAREHARVLRELIAASDFTAGDVVILEALRAVE